MSYCIKIRKQGAKSWAFLTSDGYTNRLRIHATQIAEKENAEKQAAFINANNPGIEAKVECFGSPALSVSDGDVLAAEKRCI